MGFYEARKSAGLSQMEAANRLGITDAAVCQWETGKTAPRAAMLPRIATLYHCSVDDLLRKREKNEKSVSH